MSKGSTIRAVFGPAGNLTAIETYQGSRGWVNVLAEPIQRGDIPDLVVALGGSPQPAREKARDW